MPLISWESGEAETTSGVRRCFLRYFVVRSIMFPLCLRCRCLEQLLLFRFSRRGWNRGRFRFALRHVFVQAITRVGIFLRLLPQPLGVFGLALEQHLEARLLQEIVLDFAAGGAAIEGLGILSGESALRIITIEQPLARIDRDFLV